MRWLGRILTACTGLMVLLLLLSCSSSDGVDGDVTDGDHDFDLPVDGDVNENSETLESDTDSPDSETSDLDKSDLDYDSDGDTGEGEEEADPHEEDSESQEVNEIDQDKEEDVFVDGDSEEDVELDGDTEIEQELDEEQELELDGEKSCFCDWPGDDFEIPKLAQWVDLGGYDLEINDETAVSGNMSLKMTRNGVGEEMGIRVSFEPCSIQELEFSVLADDCPESGEEMTKVNIAGSTGETFLDFSILFDQEETGVDRPVLYAQTTLGAQILGTCQNDTWYTIHALPDWGLQQMSLQLNDETFDQALHFGQSGPIFDVHAIQLSQSSDDKSSRFDAITLINLCDETDGDSDGDSDLDLDDDWDYEDDFDIENDLELDLDLDSDPDGDLETDVDADKEEADIEETDAFETETEEDVEAEAEMEIDGDVEDEFEEGPDSEPDEDEADSDPDYDTDGDIEIVFPGVPGNSCDDLEMRTIPLYDGALLPYIDVGRSTCGASNNYSETCMENWDGGEEVIYTISVSTAVNVDIRIDPKGSQWTAMALGDDCPISPYVCLDQSESLSAAPHGFGCRTMQPGIYYLQVDNWTPPACIETFDLSIVACD